MFRFLFKAFVTLVVAFFVLRIVSMFAFGGSPDRPGKVIFDQMNKEIVGYHEVEAFGNTTEAQAFAQSFSTAMKTIRTEAFSKGKAGAFSISEGHFLTSCHVDQGTMVVLCHVPEFRRFEEDAKASLMEIAWTVAQTVAATNDAKPQRLVVGLRGVLLYYQFWSGQTTGKPVNKHNASDGRNALYEILAPKVVPEQSKPPMTVPTAMHEQSVGDHHV